MKLSQSVSYAIGILIRIQEQNSQNYTQSFTASDISSGCNFPQRFLYRIFRRLVDSDILLSISGPGGGYKLARKPADITLLQIVNAVEGTIDASVLVPVQAKQIGAISLVNELCEKNKEHFQKQLSKISLQKLFRVNKKQTYSNE
jgi:Rrf2 family iron-sulfur cluster assembly transcriptional regulator